MAVMAARGRFGRTNPGAAGAAGGAAAGTGAAPGLAAGAGLPAAVAAGGLAAGPGGFAPATLACPDAALASPRTPKRPAAQTNQEEFTDFIVFFVPKAPV